MSVISTQGAGVALSAVIFPPCECGAPYGQHVVEGCHGYRPSRPVELLGTRGFRPPAGWVWWRRVATAALWIVEHHAQDWRERLCRR